MSTKSDTVILEKSKKLKNILKKRYGRFEKEKEVKKMSSKTVTVVLGLILEIIQNRRDLQEKGIKNKN